jgi:TPR repeat protein
VDEITMQDAIAAYEEDNHALSFALFDKLVKKSRDPEAMYFLGRHYIDGLGVEKSQEMAIELWKKAGKNGCVDAQYALLEIVQTTSQCCKA